MALTTLDPKTALIVVDLQKGIVGLPTIHPIGDVIACARTLANAFRRQGLPVVLVNVEGGAPGRTEQPPRTAPWPEGWADLIPELDRQPANTDLEARLKARGVTQVVIAGVATATGVESTARQAYEQGFNVTLALDAMTDRRPEAHDYSVKNVFPRLGETGTTRQIVERLTARSA